MKHLKNFASLLLVIFIATSCFKEALERAASTPDADPTATDGAGSTSIVGDDAPSAVPGFQATDYSDTSVTLSWTAVSGATQYNLYNGKELIEPLGPSRVGYQIVGLSPATKYTFAIEACTGSACGAQSTVEVTTTVEVPTTFKVSISAPSSSEFNYRIYKVGAYEENSTPASNPDSCEISLADTGTAAKKWALCIADFEEFDLHHQGYTLKSSFPGQGNTGGIVCNYKVFTPYYYAVAPFGYPPLKVAYSKNEDGVVSVCKMWFPYKSGGGVQDFADDAGSYYDCTAAGNLVNVSPWLTNLAAEQTYAVSFANEDDVRCPYDYSDNKDGRYPGGQNCCWGGYTKSVTDITSGEVTTTYEEWGGTADNCLRGPGKESHAFSADGYPTLIWNKVPDIGLTDLYKIEPPIQAMEKFDYPWDEYLFATNFFTPIGKVIFAGVGAHDDYDPTEYRNQTKWLAPFYSQVVPDDGDGSAGRVLGFPFYRYDCMNNNQEVVARIDVLVRDWNVSGELIKGDVDDNGTPDGNPNIGSTDTMEADPFDDGFTWPDYNDDKWDWDRYHADSKRIFRGW